MDVIANYTGASRTLNGELTISFVVDDDSKILQALSELGDGDLLLEVSAVKKKHSAKARKYMWKMCDLIAKKIGSTKDVVYIMSLKNAGVFDYLEIPKESINSIRHIYRYIEEIGTYEAEVVNSEGVNRIITMSELRCYEGMHDYDTAQLSALINEIVTEANNLSIPTLTVEEMERLAGIKR